MSAIGRAMLSSVGLSFRRKDDPGVVPAKVGEQLVLQRDRQNEHDANAVAVLCNGHAVGFLPRATALDAAALFFDGPAAPLLRLEAESCGFDAKAGKGTHSVMLTVYAADDTVLDDATVVQVATFCLQHPLLGDRKFGDAPPAKRFKPEPVAVEVVDLVSDDEAPPQSSGIQPSTGAQAKAWRAEMGALARESDAGPTGLASLRVRGVTLLSAWVGVSPPALARWLRRESTSPAQRAELVHACLAEMRMRAVLAGMGGGVAVAVQASPPGLKRMAGIPLPDTVD